MANPLDVSNAADELLPLKNVKVNGKKIPFCNTLELASGMTATVVDNGDGLTKTLRLEVDAEAVADVVATELPDATDSQTGQMTAADHAAFTAALAELDDHETRIDALEGVVAGPTIVSGTVALNAAQAWTDIGGVFTVDSDECAHYLIGIQVSWPAHTFTNDGVHSVDAYRVVRVVQAAVNRGGITIVTDGGDMVAAEPWALARLELRMFASGAGWKIQARRTSDAANEAVTAKVKAEISVLSVADWDGELAPDLEVFAAGGVDAPGPLLDLRNPSATTLIKSTTDGTTPQNLEIEASSTIISGGYFAVDCGGSNDASFLSVAEFSVSAASITLETNSGPLNLTASDDFIITASSGVEFVVSGLNIHTSLGPSYTVTPGATAIVAAPALEHQAGSHTFKSAAGTFSRTLTNAAAMTDVLQATVTSYTFTASGTVEARATSHALKDASGNFSKTVTCAAALTETCQNTVTSWTRSIAQASSGAGGAIIDRAGKGAAGSAGGDYTIGGGDGGTPGTDLPGSLKFQLGQRNGTRSGLGKWLAGSEDHGDIYAASANELRWWDQNTGHGYYFFANGYFTVSTLGTLLLVGDSVTLQSNNAVTIQAPAGILRKSLIEVRQNTATANYLEYEYWGESTVSTATTTSLFTFVMASGLVYDFEFDCVLKNSTDSEGARWHREATMKNMAGTGSQIGATDAGGTTDKEDAGQTGNDATITRSSVTASFNGVSDSSNTHKFTWRVKILVSPQ